MIHAGDSCERDTDVALFDALYHAHRRSLYAFLLGRTAESETAADMLQETFLRVWQHIREVRRIPDERRAFWLFAIARNIVYDHHRRRAVQRRHEEMLLNTDLSGAVADPASILEQREAAAAVDAAIARLPVGLRTVLTMHLVAEMTSAEIGTALQKPPGTVRYQLAEARKRLARDLQRMKDEG
jgi:RNA polymerase sigma-70 factor (ECF subfamily)